MESSTGRRTGRIRMMRDKRLRGHMSLRECGHGTELVLVLHETKKYKEIPVLMYADLLDFLKKEYRLTQEDSWGTKQPVSRMKGRRRLAEKRRKAKELKKLRKPVWAIQQIVRGSGLVEDICKHGVGHPNKDSVRAMKKKGLKGFEIHGCDGCCSTRSRVKK